MIIPGKGGIHSQRFGGVYTDGHMLLCLYCEDPRTVAWMYCRRRRQRRWRIERTARSISGATRLSFRIGPKGWAGCPPATQGVGRRASPKGPDSTGRAFSSRREGGMGGLCAAAGCPVIRRDWTAAVPVWRSCRFLSVRVDRARQAMDKSVGRWVIACREAGLPPVGPA